MLRSMAASPLDTRRLSWCVHLENLAVTVKLMKPPDIALLLAAGDIDFGVLPDEWVREHHAAAVAIRDLRWCSSRIVLAGDPKNFAKISRARPRIATSYPKLADECLRPVLNDFFVRHVHGSAEAFVPEWCDGVFDCVETGSTLQANGLTVLRTFLHSSVRLFAASSAVACAHSRNILTHFNANPADQHNEETANAT